MKQDNYQEDDFSSKAANPEETQKNLLYGRWEVLSDTPIHSGSADVFRVRDIEANIHGDLALKRLHKIERLERFWQEIKVLEILAKVPSPHPHILPMLFSYRPHEGTEELPYLITPWVSDGTLRQRAINQGLYAGQIAYSVQCLLPIVDAVAYLHAQGNTPKGYLAHRDLKPANVLYGPNEHAFLTDFGCVLYDERLTEAEPVGSRGYMAPELRNGRYEEEDHRPADIYSLGAMLYALLAGGDPPVNGDITSEEYHLQAKFNEPIFASVHQLLAWCMDESPSKRPPVRQLDSELRRLQELALAPAGEHMAADVDLLRRIQRTSYEVPVLAAKRSENELKAKQDRLASLGMKCLDLFKNHSQLRPLIEDSEHYSVTTNNSFGNVGSSLYEALVHYRPIQILSKSDDAQRIALIDEKLVGFQNAYIVLTPQLHYHHKLLRTYLFVCFGLSEDLSQLVILGMVSAFVIRDQQVLCDWAEPPILYKTSSNSLNVEGNLVGLTNRVVHQALSAIAWGLDHCDAGYPVPTCPDTFTRRDSEKQPEKTRSKALDVLAPALNAATNIINPVLGLPLLNFPYTPPSESNGFVHIAVKGTRSSMDRFESGIKELNYSLSRDFSFSTTTFPTQIESGFVFCSAVDAPVVRSLAKENNLAISN